MNERDVDARDRVKMTTASDNSPSSIPLPAPLLERTCCKCEENHAPSRSVAAVVLDSSICLPSPVFCACVHPLPRHYQKADRTEAILDLTGEWLPRKACDRLGP
jgi:hypothetical protein